MRKFFIVALITAILVGCGGETTKPQLVNKTVDKKPPTTTKNNSTPNVNNNENTSVDNSNKIKPLTPDNSPELHDLAWETIMSTSDNDLTEQDFINSTLIKETRPIPQRFAPDTLDNAKNSFWSDCFPSSGIGRFDDLSKDMICYPYIITHYESVYLHSGIHYNPYVFSCFNIDTGELLWTKSNLANVRFDKLSKKIIVDDLSTNKTAVIEPSTGEVLWDGNFIYLESDGNKYFLAERNTALDFEIKNSTDRKTILIGDVNTGKILNEKLINVAADVNDKASYFDLYRFFNGKPILKDSKGNLLDWNWKSREYLSLDRHEIIINNLVFLPYCSGSPFPSIYLDCYDIDTGKKKWYFSNEIGEGADIIDPDLCIIGNKLFMNYVGFSMPYSYSYLFDIYGNRYQIPSNFFINQQNKIKKNGSMIFGVSKNYKETLGLDIIKSEIIKLKPYKLAVGGKLYTGEAELSQSEQNTLQQTWSKNSIFNESNSLLDAIVTENWLITLSISFQKQLKVSFYNVSNGDLLKELLIDYHFYSKEVNSTESQVLNSDAKMQIFNKKIVIQTQMGIFILGNSNNTQIRISSNFNSDYQPPVTKHEGTGKYSSPVFDDPVPQSFIITNISSQKMDCKIILPKDNQYITITSNLEFELNPGESKEIIHSINRTENGFYTNYLIPIMIQYNKQIESVFILTAERYSPD